LQYGQATVDALRKYGIISRAGYRKIYSAQNTEKMQTLTITVRK
jgi:hypothetical protein